MRTALNPEHDGTLPCPFCGAGPEFMRYRAKPGIVFDGLGVMSQDYKDVGQISCSFCGSSGPVSDNADQAYSKWGRRVK